LPDLPDGLRELGQIILTGDFRDGQQSSAVFSPKERPFFLLSQEKSLFRGSVSLEQRLVCPSRQCSRLAGKEHERDVARAGQRL